MHFAVIAFVVGTTSLVKPGVGAAGPCTTHCGATVPFGWSGYNDGDKNCQRCRCGGGALNCYPSDIVTPLNCAPQPCPAAVCAVKAQCGGPKGLACSGTDVCLDDPSDSCVPSDGLVNTGRTKCTGCCVYNQCMHVKCSSRHECQLNAFGTAECVPTPTKQPVCCLAKPTCPAKHRQAGPCTKADIRRGGCIHVTRCCTTISCRTDSNLTPQK
ncbi:hypothetical protein DIPPA_00035 [Diplonema papillatum]|nr:hypothetical protein DIPPA_00035 [Diplonema papillatum]